jgi:hypothetical protein
MLVPTARLDAWVLPIAVARSDFISSELSVTPTRYYSIPLLKAMRNRLAPKYTALALDTETGVPTRQLP